MFPPYICLCLYMSEVISSFRSVSEGSQLFAFLMLFLCGIFVMMCSCRSMHVSFWNVMCVCLEYCICFMYVGGR